MTQEQPAPRVNPEMVVLARESQGLTQSELASLIATTQSKVSKIEAGLLEPTPRDLDAIATALDRPSSFFAWSDAVYGFGSQEMFHRKRQKATVKSLSIVHAEMNIRRMQLARLLRGVDIEANDFHRIDPDECDGDVERIAQMLRASWLVPPGPVKNVVQLIETAGAVIVPHDFRTPHVDAVSQWVPGLPPIIFANTEFPMDRLRYTLCHELGHLLMHRTVGPDAEEEADRFAAEFLMPAEQIRHSLNPLSIPILASLKLYWKVSMAALLRRASDLGTITPRQTRTLWMSMSKLKYRKSEPVEIPAERPTTFHALLAFHREELGYTFPDLRELIGDNHVKKLCEERGQHLSVVA